MRPHILILVVAFFFSFPSLFSGCLSRDRYTYKNIKAAYSPQRPEISTTRKDPEGTRASFDPSGPLTIKQAVIIALQNNPDMDMAIARIRGSAAMIDEAAAAFWPTLSFYGEYIQGNAPSAYLFKTIDQRQLPPQVNFNEPGWFENYEAGLQGRINLFRGGRDILQKKMAETGLEIQQLDRESVENALVASVIQSYYNALAAEDFIRIAEESVETVNRQLEIMQVRYRAGGALRSDILSLEVRLAQSREDLVRAENNHSLSIASLSNLLGMDPDTPMTLTHEDRIPADAPADYRSGLVYALANRAELKKTRHQVIQTRMALDSARLEYLPTLDAQGKYYLDDPGLDFDWDRENWTAGIILNWDVFTGNSTRARIDKAKSVLEEMLAADRKTTLSVQLDLKTAYLKLDEARARAAVTEASVAQAEESLRLVKRQYEGGSATITRYLDAELDRNVARIRATAAFYDREKAHAEVARSLGYWTGFAREALNHER